MSPSLKVQLNVRVLFAANVRRARTNLGLSQLGLADKLEMAHNFINDIEHARKWVSPETIQKLCLALKVQPYQLFLPEESDAIKKDQAIANCCDEILGATTQIVNKIRSKYLG